MKQIPILFSTAMVQAILEGRKTQTRRIIRPQPDENGVEYFENAPSLDWESVYKEQWKPWIWDTEDGERVGKFCPYGQPGDVLWVRETISYFKQGGGTIQREKTKYKADERWNGNNLIKWTPSIHMPKAAARIWLEVVSVKVQRLQDITEQDAVAEGIVPLAMSSMQLAQTGQLYYDYTKPKQLFNEGLQPFWSFNSLWCSINGGESWEANPWVWVVEFKRIENPNA